MAFSVLTSLAWNQSNKTRLHFHPQTTPNGIKTKAPNLLQTCDPGNDLTQFMHHSLKACSKGYVLFIFVSSSCEEEPIQSGRHAEFIFSLLPGNLFRVRE